MSAAVKLPYVRLTNQDRDNVVAKAIKDAFSERAAAIDKEEDALGRRIYEATIPEKDRKAASAMPRRWIAYSSLLHFNVGGMSLDFRLIGDAVPIPRDGCDGWSRRIGTTADPDLIEAANRFNATKEALAEDRYKAKSSLKSLVYSVKTVRALAELWPEGDPFYRWLADRVIDPNRNLPAPQIAEINALLGIPKEEKK